jgi:hypothetical protein
MYGPNASEDVPQSGAMEGRPANGAIVRKSIQLWHLEPRSIFMAGITQTLEIGMDVMKDNHEEKIFQRNLGRARLVRLHGTGGYVKKVAESERYPELENDHIRSRVVLGILEEFPSIRQDVWAYLRDMHPDELRRAVRKSP